jgi:peptide/nickel transport system substrate-binding protein
MNCDNVPNEAALDTQAVTTGSLSEYNKVIESAVKSGCWLNIADKQDAMVAQTWLKGIPQAHIVADPEMLYVAALHPG